MPVPPRDPRHAPARATRPALAAALLLACSSSGSTATLHVPSPAWEEQVIYFVMTDRFANGDRTNDDQHQGEYGPASNDRYSGGDLQGIIDHLDYIQGLGATAVWITPPVANMWWDPLQQSGGYHGYWARDLKRVDEHAGTLETYQALSRELHRRGMYLIQDIVPNHMGNFFTYAAYDPACAASTAAPGCDVTAGFVKNTGAVPTSRPTLAPFDQDDATDPAQRAAAIYHWTPTLADYADPHQETDYQVSDLDDLDTENPVVRTALRDAYGWWIKNVGVDAFRVDTVKYVPHAFWNDFFHATDPAAPGILAVARGTGRENFHAFGEVFEASAALDDAADRKVASYLGTAAAPELPGVLQYPLYAEIGRVFGSGAPTADMTYRLQRFMDPALYPNPYVLPTFVDNHDVQRFLAVGPSVGLVQALAFIFTVPGIPTVYYGTEQLFTETRQAMFQGGYLSTRDQYETRSAFYQRIKKLSDLRRGSKVFTHGALDVRYDSPAGPGPLVYRRTLAGSSPAFVLMNTADQDALVAGLDTGLPAGTVLQVLHAEQVLPAPTTLTAGPGGKLTMLLPQRAVLVAGATSQVATPPPPGAALTLDPATPVEGQTFTGDTTIGGTVSPAGTRVQVVIDGYPGQAIEAKVTGTTWSADLPISSYPTGAQQHTLALYAPAANVASDTWRFSTDVVFVGDVLDFDDPQGDDRGPTGGYTYPLATAANGHQMDIRHVKLEVGVTTMNLRVTMQDWSTLWKPDLGFDRVCFNVLLDLPGRTGLTAIPKLNASVPAGFTWSYDQFTYGWKNVMYDTRGASETAYGNTAPAPRLVADAASRTLTFVYDRRAYGLASWSGVKVYLTTWDFDGINGVFRPLARDAAEWTMGGAPSWDPVTFLSTDPKIMDDAGPFTIP